MPEPSLSHSQMFGAGLGEALHRICGNQLGDITWFRTDWQRGGALTGYATFRENDTDHEAVVKLPVPPRELRWLKLMQPHQHDAGEVVPRLLACGDRLEDYDLAWVVMEKLPHGPLDSKWGGVEWELLTDALVRFYVASRHVPVDIDPRQENWPEILRRARDVVHKHELENDQQWGHALKAVHKKMKKMMRVWAQRDTAEWCHGDVHMANAMSRCEAPAGPALLFDFAEVHAGHWVEDAVYLEHLFWGHEDRMGEMDIVKLIGHKRKEKGLKVEANWPLLANIRRVLLASSAPAYLKHRGNPAHLRASLAMVEKTLADVHL